MATDGNRLSKGNRSKKVTKSHARSHNKIYKINKYEKYTKNIRKIYEKKPPKQNVYNRFYFYFYKFKNKMKKKSSQNVIYTLSKTV